MGMIVAPSITGATEAGTSFPDLPKADSHYNAVTALVNQGAITGYEDGTFAPYESISRQHVAVILQRSLDLPVPSDKETKKVLKQYSDVKTTDMYAKEIAAVTKAKVFNGANGKFMPSESITREQMATVLYNGFGLGKYQSEEVGMNLSGVDKSHKERVQALGDLGITVALDNFNPTSDLARAQFATFLTRTLDVLENGDLVEKPETEKPEEPGEEVEKPKPEEPENPGEEVEKPSVEFDSFSFNLPREFTVGDTESFKLVGISKDGTKKDITKEAKYTVSNTKVATVKNGKVTAISKGTANLIATYEGYTVETLLTVKEKQEATTGEIKTTVPSQMKVGDTKDFKVTLDGKDITSEVRTSVGHKDIASITNGKIKALKAGFTTIGVFYGGETLELKLIVTAGNEATAEEQLLGYDRQSEVNISLYNEFENVREQVIDSYASDLGMGAKEVEQTIEDAVKSKKVIKKQNDNVAFYYDSKTGLLHVNYNEK